MIAQRTACRKGTSALLWIIGALIMFMMIPAAPMFVELWIFGIAFWFMIIGFRRYGLMSISVLVIAIDLYHMIVGIVEFLTAVAGVLTLVVALIKTAEFSRRYSVPAVESSRPLTFKWQFEYSRPRAANRLVKFVLLMLLIDLNVAIVLYSVTFLAPQLATRFAIEVAAVYWLTAGVSTLDLVGSIILMFVGHGEYVRNPTSWMLVAVTGAVMLLTYCLFVLALDIRVSWATASITCLVTIEKRMPTMLQGILTSVQWTF